MLEKDFQKQICDSINLHPRGKAYKIPDDMGGGKFALKRPADILSSVNSKSVIIEVKRKVGYRAFGIKDFQPHQPDELDEWMSKGSRAFVFLVIWEARTLNRLIIMDWAEWGPRLRESSIKAKELKTLPFIQGHKKMYDLAPWIDMIGSVKRRIRDFL